MGNNLIAKVAFGVMLGGSVASMGFCAKGFYDSLRDPPYSLTSVEDMQERKVDADIYAAFGSFLVFALGLATYTKNDD
ncbi:MAG: hypothetical protein V1888_00510 [archaeon]